MTAYLSGLSAFIRSMAPSSAFFPNSMTSMPFMISTSVMLFLVLCSFAASSSICRRISGGILTLNCSFAMETLSAKEKKRLNVVESA